MTARSLEVAALTSVPRKARKTVSPMPDLSPVVSDNRPIGFRG